MNAGRILFGHTSYSEIVAFLKNLFDLAFLDPVDVVKSFVEDLKPIQPEDESV